MTTHIMVDLETWGTTPGSDIRSIGAVVFDPVAGTLGDTFYVATENPAGRWCQGEFRPDLAKGLNDRRYPLTRDPATVEWWSEQSAEAQGAFADPVDLAHALDQFGHWWAGVEVSHGDIDGPATVTFWAHGPHFDEQILAACYRAVRLPVPWHYRAARDCRTIWEAAGWPEVAFVGTQHNALDDAKNQALKVIEAYRRLGLAGDPQDRVSRLLRYNNEQVEKRRAATALLREASDLFRFYETSHRAKVLPDDGSHTVFMMNRTAISKANRNAEIAGRIELFLKEIHQ